MKTYLGPKTTSTSFGPVFRAALVVCSLWWRYLGGSRRGWWSKWCDGSRASWYVTYSIVDCHLFWATAYVSCLKTLDQSTGDIYIIAIWSAEDMRWTHVVTTWAGQCLRCKWMNYRVVLILYISNLKWMEVRHILLQLFHEWVGSNFFLKMNELEGWF